MQEIINIHIGEAGIRTGQTSWELFCLEHGVSPDGQMPINQQYEGEEEQQKVIFKEDQQGKQIPRCVFLDLEPTVIDQIRTGPFRQLFHPEHLVSGKEDTANNFARGRYTLGKEFIDICLDRIRRQADDCQNLQGFIIHHSVGGGTGSGLGSLLLQRLAVDYEKKTKLTYDIFPSEILSKSIVEPYNTVLATHSLHEHSDISIVLDNEAIYDICKIKLEIDRPTFKNLNHFIAQLISQQTVSLRFAGCLNPTLAEIQTNLIPYPAVHYLLSSLNIIKKEQDKLEFTSTISEQLFQQMYMVAKCDVSQGKYMACSIIYRGDYIPKYIGASIANIKTRKNIQFVDWCPTGFKVGINYHQPKVLPESNMDNVSRIASMLANNTAIREVFVRFKNKFDLMFSKRAFLHHYLKEGMEEMEFIEAKEDIEQIETDYRDAEEQNEEEVLEIEEEKKQ